MSDFVKPGPDGPVLDFNAMRAHGKALLNAEPSAQPATPPPSTPAPAPPVTQEPAPSATPATSSLQSTVTVTEQAKPGQENRQPEQSPVAAQPAAQPVPQEIIDLPDDKLVEVVVDGVKQVLPWGQAKTGVTLQRKFTKEMQAFRSEEGKLREAADLGNKLRTLVTSPDLLVRYAQSNPQIAQAIQRAFGVQPQQVPQQVPYQVPAAPVAPFTAPAPRVPFQVQNPDEVVNMGELAQYLGMTTQDLEQRIGSTLGHTIEERLGKVVDQVRKEIAASIQQLEDSREITAFNIQIDQTVNELVKQHPVLSKVPYYNEILRQEVKALQPKSPQEMLEAFHTAAQGIVDEIRSEFQREQQASLAAKQEMIAGNIEPPTGQAPNTTIQAQRPDFRRGNGQYDFKAMREYAKQVLNQR